MRRQLSMPKKTSATVLCICLLFGLISWPLLFAQADKLAKEAVADMAGSALNQLHESILSPLLRNDTISQQVALQRITEDSRIISASLNGIDGELLAQSINADSQGVTVENFSENIEFQNTQAGVISIAINSRPIYQKYHRIFINWLFLWLSFTLLSTYISYRFVDQIISRIVRINDRLPGKTEPLADEISALETKIQPLLSTSGESTYTPNNRYFYSLISANIKNHQRLLQQLNKDNLDQLFEKLDYSILRTLQLYGGDRVEGMEDSFCFTIRSTQCSKQHLLVCLMAVYTLQQLIEQLSKKIGIDLEINWVINSDDIEISPKFWHEQSLLSLKKNNLEIASNLQEGLILLNCDQFDIDELSSIARFQRYETHQFILEGFSENRLQLLHKQLEYLIRICLD
ncbi:MAG: hypothetical protein ACJ0Q0_03560 [Porticoccaceae bacterium]|jgi:uncharacterized membrane protein affecting hemolysin expression